VVRAEEPLAVGQRLVQERDRVGHPAGIPVGLREMTFVQEPGGDPVAPVPGVGLRIRLIVVVSRKRCIPR
jgi:hypothetical protein